MKIRHLLSAAAVPALLLCACDDDVSQIGGSLSMGEVTILVDSLATDLESECVYYDSFDGRNSTKLLGRINVPQYGRLSCSFVSQMMSATKMNIPDSIGVEDLDSMRLVLSVPRGSLTGDSLAPQQLKVYRLEKGLPAGISSTFDPDGYYNPARPMGTRSYTLSNIAKGDSALKRDAFVRIPVHMPMEFARDLFNKYRAGDPVFQWPATFNEYFPGIYVEQNFGNGCIANISKAEMFTYWHRTVRENKLQPDSTYAWVDRIVRDSVCLLASQPEVLSSNVIRYDVSDYIRGLAEAGKRVITTPGGYRVNFRFPVQRLIDEFRRNGAAISVVSSLRMEIPAEAIDNDFGLDVAQHLLMIRKNEYEEFFRENKVPDGKSSFYAAYNADNGSYQFNSMRSYFLQILEDDEKGETIDADDTEFVLVPVAVKTESVTNYDGSSTIYVTRCQPYLERPTMTQLHTDRAIICFTYSSQQIK